MYSQNQEEKYIVEYFGEFKGRLLDIGANDGKTLSNSLRLIELGWSAVLVEPSSKCCEKIRDLHCIDRNVNVGLFQCAIGAIPGQMILHESGELLGTGDTSLVSTLIPKEKERWTPINMKWEEVEVNVITIQNLFEIVGSEFDFISIDAEGMDYEILCQIDLTNTKLVCVETNSIETEKYIDYCKQYGMRLIYKNAENILMAK